MTMNTHDALSWVSEVFEETPGRIAADTAFTGGLSIVMTAMPPETSRFTGVLTGRNS